MAGKAELTVGIKGDNSHLKKTLTETKQHVSAFASGQLHEMASLVTGAFAVGELVAWGKEVMKNGKEIQDVSVKLGMTTDQYQALTAQATKHGVAAEFVTAKLFKLADSQGDVINGNKQAQAAFERLGVSQADVIRLNMPELLQKVAEGAKNDATAVSDLNTVFGRGAANEMQEVLEGLAEQTFPDLIKQMKEAGMVLDKEVIGKLAQAQADWNMFKAKTSVKGTEMAVNAVESMGSSWRFLKTIGGAMLNSDVNHPITDWHGLLNSATVAFGDVKHAPLPGSPKDDSEARKQLADQKELEAWAKSNHELLRIQDAQERGKAKIYDELDKAKKNATVSAPEAADSMAAKGMFVGGQTNPFLQEAKLASKYAELNAEYAQKTYEFLTGGEG